MTKPKLVAVILLASVSLAVAGSTWWVKCETSGCKFGGRLGIGGGFIFDEKTGYCTTCKKFVSLSWKVQGPTNEWKKGQNNTTNLLETAPATMGTVWNPATGLITYLFPCPKCGKPFMPIDQVSLVLGSRRNDHLFCPVCTNLSVKVQGGGLIYD